MCIFELAASGGTLVCVVAGSVMRAADRCDERGRGAGDVGGRV